MTQLCRHFGTCGGCTFQDVAETEYRARKRDAVVRALANAGVDAEVMDVVAVPPGTRRRATLKIGKTVADRAKEKGIKQVVFDRGGYLYHGRIKALAEAAREAGLEF